MSYDYVGVAYSAKIGAIITPAKGLRIGAAVQTPTVTKIEESWIESGETEFSGVGGGKYSSESPYGENSWSFRTPLKANFGLAYTFGKSGLISADYELCNYSNTRYQSSRYTDRSVLEEINDEMRNSYGMSHKVRIGMEVKPLPTFAIRAGYNLNVSAEKAIWDGFEYVNIDPTFGHKAAVGLGFSSHKSFFADIACTRAILPKEYFMPYSDYVFTYTKEGDITVDPNYYAPEILIKSSLWNIILTIGFRF